MPPLRAAGAMCLGAFDGLHLGHQAILRRLQAPVAAGLKPTAVLFEPLPRTFFSTQIVPRLQTLRDKLLSLSAAGIQQVVCLRFNQDIATMTAETFVHELLLRRLTMRRIVIGEDFRFGHRRLGDVSLLEKLAKKYRFTLDVVTTQRRDNQRISSTQIRSALLAGNLKKVQQLLGRPYSFSGRIGYGQQRGTALGFPTANVFCGRHPPPLAGVYAAEVRCNNEHRQTRRGVLNAGTRPTFANQRYQLEVHIPDYHDNLYGRRLQLTLLSRIRSEMKFRDAGELRKKIAQDIEAALNVSG